MTWRLVRMLRTMDETTMNISTMVVPFLLSALLGWLFIPRVLILSHRKRLFDMPDERKMHEMPVPRLGGITFLPILLMSITLVMGLWVMLGHTYQVDNLPLLVTRFLLLFVGLMMLYLVGVVDDLIGVSYQAKFMVQIVCVFLTLFRMSQSICFTLLQQPQMFLFCSNQFPWIWSQGPLQVFVSVL